MAFTVFPYDAFGFSIGQVFNALLGSKVEFHPETFIGRIDETIGVTTETMHMTVAGRNTTV